MDNHKVGETVNFVYHGRTRQGEIIKVAYWGLVVNVYGEGVKSFRFDKMYSVRTLAI